MPSRRIMRVERHVQVNSEVCEAWCQKAGLLYNYCNYQIRQQFFAIGKLLNHYDLIRQLTAENQPDYRALPAQTAQQTILRLFKNWKAFFAAQRQYAKHPETFLGKPKLPKYKRGKKQSLLVLTNQQCRIMEGFVRFPKMVGFAPLKTSVLPKQLKEVRVSPQATCHIIEIVYEMDCDVDRLPEDHVLAIDLGVSNFATCIGNVGLPPFILNGKPLKALNQWYNKEFARLKSSVGDKSSRRIRQVTFRRNQRVADYLHKTSRIIVNYCVTHQIGRMVIGKNHGWKQGIALGKRTNQSFVQIPFARLIDMLTYKAEEVGIVVECTEEAYTSKCDHLAGEPMQHHEHYAGKRVKRGLFQSSTGRLINADVHGAIGIGRKVMGETFVQTLLHSGVVLTPVRMNIFTKDLCKLYQFA